MRAVIQRVASASVRVEEDTIASIERGLLVLLGVATGDSPADAAWLADKIAALRLFPGEQGRFDRSVKEAGGTVLVVSQFTLYADCRKGRRPSFAAALGGDEARRLYEVFLDRLRAQDVAVQSGRFGADMQVALINDGPVTILLDHPSERR